MELAVVMAVLAVLAGGALAGIRQIGRRALQNASLQLQADMRYAQRRAVAEGRQFGILFDTNGTQYRIISSMPEHTVRTVTFSGGVRLDGVTTQRLMFHPRGTPSAGFRAVLAQGSDTQRITVTVSGGRVRVFEINELDYE
jgi:Tfp pilus assembly protein FimT